MCAYVHTMACVWSSEDNLQKSRWVLELERRLTGLVASTFTHQAISPDLCTLF